MTWNRIRAMLAAIVAVGDDVADEHAAQRAALEEGRWFSVVDGLPVLAWVAQAVLIRPAVVRARAAGFDIPGDEVASSMLDLVASSGGPPVIQHWSLASSNVIRRYKFPNGDIYGFERAPLVKIGVPPVDVPADQWRYLPVVPVFPDDKPAAAPTKPAPVEPPAEPDRGDAYEGPDPEPPPLKLLQGGDDPGDAPPDDDSGGEVDPDIAALMRGDVAPEAPAPAPALPPTVGPQQNEGEPICPTHDMPFGLCGCKTMGEVLGVDPDDLFAPSSKVADENAAREANEALAAADRKRMVEALRGTRLTPAEIMDRARLGLADLAGCVAVLIDGADPRDADIPPCAEFRMPLVGTQPALARRSPPGCGACGHPLGPHVPNAPKVDRTTDPEDGTRPGAPGTRNDPPAKAVESTTAPDPVERVPAGKAPPADPTPPEPVAGPADAPQVPPFRPDGGAGGGDPAGDVSRAGVGGGDPAGSRDAGGRTGAALEPAAPDAGPGVARCGARCDACGFHAIGGQVVKGQACPTCGAGDGALRVWEPTGPEPGIEWPRLLKRHGRDGVHVGGVVGCKLCAKPIGSGEAVRFLPRLPARRAHSACLYPPVDYGGEPDPLFDAPPDPPMPPAPEPVDVGAPVQSPATDPRDPCRWNPEANRETSPGDPWHNPAALLCGTGKATTRLCRTCADLPAHTKKKTRRPLGKGVAA